MKFFKIALLILLFSLSVAEDMCPSAKAVWNASCGLNLKGKEDVEVPCIGAEYIIAGQRKRRTIRGRAAYLGLLCEHDPKFDPKIYKIAVAERGVKAKLASDAGYQGLIIINPLSMPVLEKAGFGDVRIPIAAAFLNEKAVEDRDAIQHLRGQGKEGEVYVSMALSLSTESRVESYLFESSTILDKINGNANKDEVDKVVPAAAGCLNAALKQCNITVRENIDFTQFNLSSSSVGLQHPERLRLLASDTHMMLAELYNQYAASSQPDLASKHYFYAALLANFTHLAALTNLADLLYKYRVVRWSATTQDGLYLRAKSLAQSIVLSQFGEFLVDDIFNSYGVNVSISFNLVSDLDIVENTRATDSCCDTVSDANRCNIDVSGDSDEDTRSRGVSMGTIDVTGDYPDLGIASIRRRNNGRHDSGHDSGRHDSGAPDSLKESFSFRGIADPGVVIESLSNNQLCDETEDCQPNYFFPQHQSSPLIILSQDSPSPRLEVDAVRIGLIGSDPNNTQKHPDDVVFTSMNYSNPHVFLVNFSDCFVAGPAGIPICIRDHDNASPVGEKLPSRVAVSVYLSSADSLVPVHVLNHLRPELSKYFREKFKPLKQSEPLKSIILSEEDRREVQYLPGVVISALQMSCDNYYHFVTQCLPRLLLSLQLLTESEGGSTLESSLDNALAVLPVTLLIPCGRKRLSGEAVAMKFVSEILVLLNINNGSVYTTQSSGRKLSLNIVMQQHLSITKVDTLLLVDWRQRGYPGARSTGMELTIPRVALRLLRRQLLTAGASTSIGTRSRVTDVDRADTDLIVIVSRGKGNVKTRKHRPEAALERGRSRHILNEDEVEVAIRNALNEMYSNCLSSESKSKSGPESSTLTCRKPKVVLCNADEGTVADAISLFSRASVIVGVHGAGLTNMIFAPSAYFDGANQASNDKNSIFSNSVDDSAICDKQCTSSCQPATAVVEISLPAPRLRDFQHLSASLGHTYWRTDAPPDATFESAFSVNASHLALVVESAWTKCRCMHC